MSPTAEFEWDRGGRRLIISHGRRSEKSAMTTVRRTRTEIRRRGGQVDWARVKSTTDEDIDRMIAADGETAPDMAPRRNWRRVLKPQVPDVQAIRRKIGLS